MAEDPNTTESRLQWLASFPQTNPNPIVEFNAHGLITFANEAAFKTLKTLGLAENPSLFIPDDKDEIIRLLSESSEIQVTREIQLNGSWFLENIALNHELQVVRIYADNITGRKKAEDELRRKNKEFTVINENLIATQETLKRIIEEHKKTEKELRNSEERFRLALKNAPVSVAIQDADLTFQWAYNQRAIRPEDIRGRKDTDLFLPEDAERLVELKRRVLETGKNARELIWLTVNGKRLYLDLYLEPLRDDTGRITGVGIATVDLTDQELAVTSLRESQKQLRRTQELLEAVTKEVDVIIAVQDTNFCYTFFNQAYKEEIKRLTGKDLLVGTSMIDLFADLPEEQKMSVKEWSRVMKGEKINEVMVFGNPGRDRRVYHVHHTPVRDETGSIIAAGEIAYDITKQKLIDDELRETKEYLNNLITYANAPIIVWDPQFHITLFNHAFEHLTGWKEKEVLGQNLEILLPDSSLVQAMNLIKKAWEGERWDSVEIPILHKEGNVRTVLWNSASIFGPDGCTVVSTIAQGQDITERKKIEAALMESEEKFRSIAISTPDHILVQDRDLRYTFVLNPQLGLSEEEMIGKTDFDLLSRDNAENLTKIKKGVMDSRSGIHVEIPIIGQSGKTEYFKGAYIPKLDSDDQVNGIIGYFTNITPHKKMEEELKNALSLLNASFESTADGIIVVDLQGIINSYNQNFLNMWDLPKNLLGTGETEMIHHVLKQLKAPDEFLASIQELHLHPGRESFDMIEFKDGKIFERYSKPQKIGESIVGRVWSYRDITDRKQAEVKLLTSLEEKEVLLREIHHRVKNNLQLVSGLLDMTRMRSTDESTNSILTDMMFKIQTMAQIHTRLYESKQFGRINLTDQIRDQSAGLSGIYSHKDHEITCEIDPNEVFLPVDLALPCALAVNEILSNAYKHAFIGRKTGTIEISTVMVNGHAHITVRDDGIGISKTVDIQRTNTLGIKLIRTLIQNQLKGSVTVNSHQGTEIIIEFPVTREGA